MQLSQVSHDPDTQQAYILLLLLLSLNHKFKKEGTQVVLSRKQIYTYDDGNNLTNYLLQVRHKIVSGKQSTINLLRLASLRPADNY